MKRADRAYRVHSPRTGTNRVDIVHVNRSGGRPGRKGKSRIPALLSSFGPGPRKTASRSAKGDDSLETLSDAGDADKRVSDIIAKGDAPEGENSVYSGLVYSTLKLIVGEDKTNKFYSWMYGFGGSY